MLKKLGRLALLFMAIMGQINVVLVTALVATETTTGFQLRILPAIHATAWHLRNGNAVTYAGHRFHLPAFWYPSPNPQIGGLDLQYAPLGSLSFDSIHLKTWQRLDGQTLQHEFANTATHLNQRSSVPDQWRLEILQGRTLTFHCMASHDQLTHLLICQAADSDLRLVLSTGASDTTALNILETSE